MTSGSGVCTLSQVPEPIHVSAAVFVPREAIRMKAVRSSGPGGQNVNKVASKVELRIDLGAIRGLSPGDKARLQALVATRVDAEGRLLVTSQRSRDQSANLEDARDKVRRLIEKSLIAPRDRRSTRPHAAARARRLDTKRIIAVRKQQRGRVRPEE